MHGANLKTHDDGDMCFIPAATFRMGRFVRATGGRRLAAPTRPAKLVAGLVQNTQEDGYEWTAPVGAFPPNGYGLQRIGVLRPNESPGR